LEVGVSGVPAMITDSLSDALDYTKLYKTVVTVSEKRRYNLLEAFAQDICVNILDAFSEVVQVIVKIRKLNPPIGGSVKNVEVEIHAKR
jgi:dihydroneopterin aldolase